MNCMMGMVDEKGVCAICHSSNDSIRNTDRHLPLGSILRGKYIVGRVLGEGGFGITYIGLDLDLQARVAIKEFCPRDSVSRETTNHLTLLPYDKESEEFFEEEKEKFLNEARRLGKFRGQEGIVSVMDYFKENGTAYIVMEYIEGLNLKKYLGSLDSRMKVQEVLTLLKPVLKTLNMMHEENLIHRDISPDNIMICKDQKRVCLIDFGSAREVNGEHSLSVYKKGSYTPLEQQSRNGKQGPWTDVYALCAMMYYCITGRDIPEAVERTMEEKLIPPSKLGVEIPEHVEQAILNGLVLNPSNRTQNVGELMKELYDSQGAGKVAEKNLATPVMEVAPEPKKEEQQRQEVVPQEVVQKDAIQTPPVKEQSNGLLKLGIVIAIVFVIFKVIQAAIILPQYQEMQQRQEQFQQEYEATKQRIEATKQEVQQQQEQFQKDYEANKKKIEEMQQKFN